MHELLGTLVRVPLGVGNKTRTIIDEGDQERSDPLCRAGEDLARALVEVKVKQL